MQRREVGDATIDGLGGIVEHRHGVAAFRQCPRHGPSGDTGADDDGVQSIDPGMLSQKRTITVNSGQPPTSKWWWIGAIRNTRR